MRRILIIALLALSFNAIAQNAGISTVGSHSACPGTKITVSVNLTKVTNLSGITLTIYYDATVLSALQNGNTGAFLSNVNTACLPLGTWFYNQTTKSTGIKQIKVGWTSTGSQLDTNASGVAHLFDVTFRYYGGSTGLIFDNSFNTGQNCEYNDGDQGNTLNDSPTSSYYINGTITDLRPSAPTSISYNPSSTICNGSTITLTESGGVIVAASVAKWKWYSGSCGGTYENSGSSLVASPTVSTYYYIRAEGDTCGTITNCATALVTVHTYSIDPSSVTTSPSNTVCSGTAMTLTESGGVLGVGAIWYWYTGT